MRKSECILLILLLVSLFCFYYFLLEPEIVGFIYDDGIYLLGSKAIALGHGYHLISEPGMPAIVKYPPFFPLALTPFWLINPDFPANLMAMKITNAFLSICLLGLVFFIARRYYQLNPWLAGLICLLTGLNPAWVMISTEIMSEPLYGLLSAMTLSLGISAGQNRGDLKKQWIPMAGLSIAAYLTRSIGLSLLISLVCYLWQKADWRTACRYLFWVVVAMTGWWSWTLDHPGKLYLLSGFIIASYNQSYWMEFLLEIIKWQGVGQLFLQNIISFPRQFLAALIPISTQFLEASSISYWCALAFGAGMIAFYKLNNQRKWPLLETSVFLYLLFSFCWHAHDQYARLIAPVLPFVWLLIIHQAQQYWARLSQLGQRATQVVCLLLLSCAIWSAFTTSYGAMKGNSLIWHDYKETFAEIQRISHPKDILWARHCAVFPLYTGRATIGRNVIPTHKVYQNPSEAQQRFKTLIQKTLENEKVRYVILEPNDALTRNLLTQTPQHFQKMFESAHGYLAIYRYR